MLIHNFETAFALLANADTESLVSLIVSILIGDFSMQRSARAA
jgi:hypothetical protein